MSRVGSRLHAFPRVMSSRYADNSNASSHREDNHCEVAEAPLPTYDEVIGNENPNHTQIGFKTDVLLPPSNSRDQGQSSADAPNCELHAGEQRCFSSCKENRTGIILILLGMMLIPMCAMIIILQVKFCATEQQSIDKINASYSQCMDELSALEDSQNAQENRIRDLNYQVQTLNEENKRLQGMLFKKNLNSIEE